ncbi:myb-like protein X [Impatiens glandulifera]|uniref:myb-like protein X n=1 Tax=Impatiens glandulifera TaxID=253017 RepID=UPI001FB156BA|nr:myb-like protein X [Impatiens glandulifera]
MEKSLYSGVDFEQIDNLTDDLFEGFTNGKRVSREGECEDEEPKEPTLKPANRKRKAEDGDQDVNTTLKEANLKRKLDYDIESSPEHYPKPANILSPPIATSNPQSPAAPTVGCKCDELKEELKELKIDIMTIKETQQNHHAYMRKLEMKTNEGEDAKKEKMNEEMENEEKVNEENKDEEKEKMKGMMNEDENNDGEENKDEKNEGEENEEKKYECEVKENEEKEIECEAKENEGEVKEEEDEKEINEEKKKEDDEIMLCQIKIDTCCYLLRKRIAKYSKTYKNKVAIGDYLLGDKFRRQYDTFLKDPEEYNIEEFVEYY